MPEKDSAVPQIFRHCTDVYTAMKKTAAFTHEGGVKMLVWEGHLTKLIGEDLGLPSPYYSNIRQNLTRMGCIRQLRRGGGPALSQWELVKAPTEDLFFSSSAPPSQRSTALSSYSQQISDLAKRISSLERNQAAILDAFNDSKESV